VGRGVVSRLVEVDLDDAGQLERVWQELRRHRTIRDADPELRAAIVRRCEKLPAAVANPILRDLDEVHPDVVLEAHFTTMVPNYPTLGFYRRRDLEWAV
jgi:hypothetical protein